MCSPDPMTVELTNLLTKISEGYDLTRREFRCAKVFYAENRADFSAALDDCQEDEVRTLALCAAIDDYEARRTGFEVYFQRVTQAYQGVRDRPGRGRELRAEIALHVARAAGFYPSFNTSQARLDNGPVVQEFLGSLIHIRKGLLKYVSYKRRQSKREPLLPLDLAA